MVKDEWRMADGEFLKCDIHNKKKLSKIGEFLLV